MRGVNLNVFDFDYDLTWAAFFMNADEKIHGRYGGREAPSADTYLTLPALKNALRAALAAHRREPKDALPHTEKPHMAVELYPAAMRLKQDACIHCHNVYDFRREQLRTAGKWQRENIWVYPLPDNVGLRLDPEQGNRVRSVTTDSPAGRAGLRTGDLVTGLTGLPVASFADAQYALHRAPQEGTIAITWQRDGRPLSAPLELARGWRETDISWRESMWGLEPQASVHGKDLTAEEKKTLGFTEKRLAFRQGKFVPPHAREAGVRDSDIIIGIEDKPLELTMLQFNAYVRLNYQVGERITLNIIRDGQRLNIPMKLPGRPQS